MFHHALKGLEKRIVEAHRGSISGEVLRAQEKELRSPEEAGVNRVFVFKTS
jgi:hypothetical protein